MSYIVARMQKMKTQNLGGIQKHNQREFENHSNKDIDVNRSHLNFDLVNPSNVDYRERTMNIIEEQREDKKAIRKDAVLVNEWIITSDQEFFKDMDLEETEKFFAAAAEFYEERYGKQNIAYAQVHLDETTPHMHLGVVPMRDGKLQAKNIFNRKELFAVQDDLPKFLEKKGFSLERGEPNGQRKHLTVNEFKDMQSRITELAQIEEEQEKRIKTLEKEKESLERQIKRSKEDLEIRHGRQQLIDKKQVKIDGQVTTAYLIPETEVIRLDGIRKASSVVLSENKRLEDENKLLKARINVLEKAQEQVSQILKTAKRHASKFAEGVFERAVTYAKNFSKNKDPLIEKEKMNVLENINESPLGIEDYQDHLKKKREFDRRNSLER